MLEPDFNLRHAVLRDSSHHRPITQTIKYVRLLSQVSATRFASLERVFGQSVAITHHVKLRPFDLLSGFGRLAADASNAAKPR